MTDKIMKPRNRVVLAFEVSFVLAMVALWVFWIRPTGKAQDMPTLAHHVHIVGHSVRMHFRESRTADPDFIMPETLPDSIIGKHDIYTGSKDEYVQYLIDPFTREKNGPILKGKLRTRDVSFRISGSKLSYIRLHDDAALMYAFGPDGDDDLADLPEEKLLYLNPEDVIHNYSTVSYDPTNGLISGGDVVVYINVTSINETPRFSGVKHDFPE